MKIKLSILCAAMLVSATVFAQPQAIKKGYRANMGVSFMNCTTKGLVGSSIFAETVHGYSDGKGTFIGLGTGLGYSLVNDDAYIPIYLKVKYNFNADKNYSPYASLRAGGLFNTSTDFEENSLVISSGVGFDFSRFSVELSYVFNEGKARSVPMLARDYWTYFKAGYLSAGFFYNF